MNGLRTRMVRLRKLISVSACACTMLAIMPASAGNLDVRPYFWLPNISGKVSLGTLSVPIKLGAGELLQGVKAGGMGYAAWSVGQGFFYTDTMFADFSDKQFTPFFDQSVRGKLFATEIGYAHRFAVGNSPKLEIAPYLGGRYVRLDIGVSGNLLQTDVLEAWAEPLAGVIISLPLGGRWSAIGKAGVGGFFVGGRHSHDIAAAVDYSIGSKTAITLGYRYSNSDYRHASEQAIEIDLTASGPAFGMRFIF